jgi:hypothetical protein
MPRQLTNHRHLQCVTTLREIKNIFQPIYQELPIFRRVDSSKRKGGEEGKEEERRKKREKEGREETTHVLVSHVFPFDLELCPTLTPNMWHRHTNFQIQSAFCTERALYP